MPGRGIYRTIVVTLCAASIVATLGWAGTAHAASPAKRQLLGTLEFKGSLSKLPKWTRVLDKMKAWKGYFNDAATANHPSKQAWNTLKASLKGASEIDKLKAVTKFFNKWPYRLDKANWGVSEYWATPWEFLKKSGDCEDYSIAKFYGLQELGFSGDQMRIVAVKDAIRGIGHAVLAVYATDDIYILDNQTVMVLSHEKYKHYIPQYSVNEKYRWMHVAPKKQTTYEKK
ncbi:transglutaminase-like cysteine peptidase [Pseudodesulfovibrio indicus]|uniref:transglutaminase-like cysteine peptidase n=1 Tax=Pseudodesulfovibrio indicus TaxID=1716143 RepID=UPI0029305180|nr:transglutaminase-like cysteine peptidase [Pseudodesulfovibrio indicus]